MIQNFIIFSIIRIYKIIVNYCEWCIEYKICYETGYYKINNFFHFLSNKMETCDFPNQHIVLYGASGSGKTRYIKNYLKTNNIENYVVFVKDEKEWKETVGKVFLDYNIIPKLKNHVIILDDVEDQIKIGKENTTIINLVKEGRHLGNTAIIVSHSCKNISNQIRQNVCKIVVFARNTAETFKAIKETYEIDEPIDKFREPFGYIEYFVFDREVKYFNKDYQEIVLDRGIGISIPKEKTVLCREYIADIKRQLKLTKYRETIYLTRSEEKELKRELEDELDNKANIPGHLVRAYLAMYYRKKSIDFNKEKYRHILSDYYSLQGYFTRFWLIASSTDFVPTLAKKNVNAVLKEI